MVFPGGGQRHTWVGCPCKRMTNCRMPFPHASTASAHSPMKIVNPEGSPTASGWDMSPHWLR